MTARTLTIAGGTYPLVLPNIRDPRLHVAAVIITVHVLGQVGLHFDVSVPQILAAIVTCAILEIALTFRASRAFVWPASAMFLLRETDRSVTDICLDVGFTSLGTFSRMFREIVGETPSGYRAGNGPIVAPNCMYSDAVLTVGSFGLRSLATTG